jgi:ABC-type ATPase with predicted acetyltransferase domain
MSKNNKKDKGKIDIDSKFDVMATHSCNDCGNPISMYSNYICNKCGLKHWFKLKK